MAIPRAELRADGASGLYGAPGSYGASGLCAATEREVHEFGTDRLDRGRRFNRVASGFPFGKVAEAVTRKAHKEGVGIKPVWPAHTSTAGYWKYMDRYGVTVHHGPW
ncbi:MAG TPA: hypothetical protein GX513_14735 [Firmicutes bacterium]|nr:hypothetical protein [Bacillota bacterium]